MKRIIATIMCFILLLLTCSCGGRGNKNNNTDVYTTDGETTSEEQTTDGTTSVTDTTSEPEPSVPESSEAPYEPLYEDGGFTYAIDIRPYLQYICTGGSSEYLMLANRKNPIGTYSPNDLVYITDSTYLLRRTAKEAFEAMRAEMQALGVYDTYHTSTFRSHTYQNTLYNKYLAQEREKHPELTTEELMNIVDTYSARPGTSDHQTGLTIDFYPLTESFENKKAFKYMMENAHKFGFILRFPEGDTYITGYTYEPWHWRFVGREVATFIHNHNMTLEKYISLINGTELETFPETTPIPPVTKPQTTTTPPTTEPPTTEPPTTEPPTTEPPTTEPPTTEPPTTEPPTTEPPTTESDSTEPDTTEPPDTSQTETSDDSSEPESSAPDESEPEISVPDSSEDDSEPDETGSNVE